MTRRHPCTTASVDYNVIMWQHLWSEPSSNKPPQSRKNTDVDWGLAEHPDCVALSEFFRAVFQEWLYLLHTQLLRMEAWGLNSQVCAYAIVVWVCVGGQENTGFNRYAIKLGPSTHTCMHTLADRHSEKHANAVWCVLSYSPPPPPTQHPKQHLLLCVPVPSCTLTTAPLTETHSVWIQLCWNYPSQYPEMVDDVLQMSLVPRRAQQLLPADLRHPEVGGVNRYSLLCISQATGITSAVWIFMVGYKHDNEGMEKLCK